MSRRHATPAGRSEPLLIALAILGDRPAATATGATVALLLTICGYLLITGAFSVMGVLLTYTLLAAAVVAGLTAWAWRRRAARAEPPA